MNIPVNLFLVVASLSSGYVAMETINDSLMSGIFVLIGITFIVNPFFAYVGSFKHEHYMNIRRAK